MGSGWNGLVPCTSNKRVYTGLLLLYDRTWCATFARAAPYASSLLARVVTVLRSPPTPRSAAPNHPLLRYLGPQRPDASARPAEAALPSGRTEEEFR